MREKIESKFEVNCFWMWNKRVILGLESKKYIYKVILNKLLNKLDPVTTLACLSILEDFCWMDPWGFLLDPWGFVLIRAASLFYTADSSRFAGAGSLKIWVDLSKILVLHNGIVWIRRPQIWANWLCKSKILPGSARIPIRVRSESWSRF